LSDGAVGLFAYVLSTIKCSTKASFVSEHGFVSEGQAKGADI